MSSTPQPLHPDPEIAASLEFDPVPRKLERVDGWTAERQRAFIAALALTGSPIRAARAIGKFAAGVEKLRKAPGAQSFAAAWDRAIEVESAQRAGRLQSSLDKLQPRSAPAPVAEVPTLGGLALFPPIIPVICDACRADYDPHPAFVAILDLLDFDPVPVPTNSRPWQAETQRAFIAALALTGSPERAAREVRRDLSSAQKLRKARGARGFSRAWEAAEEHARERGGGDEV